MGFDRLYTIPLAGGASEEVPLPMAEEGSYSPDNARLAYVPLRRAFETWKHYRGGRTTPIWIADLATSRVEKIPRDNSNDFQPMWRGGSVYFLSDRDGVATLFSYDTKTHRVKRLLENRGMDIYWASMGPDAIAHEEFGSLHLFDLKSGRSDAIDIACPMPISPQSTRTPQRLSIPWRMSACRPLAPSCSKPTEKSSRRIQPARCGIWTNTPGVADRDPAWSPDGKQIAYFSDESGEYTCRSSQAGQSR